MLIHHSSFNLTTVLKYSICNYSIWNIIHTSKHNQVSSKLWEVQYGPLDKALPSRLLMHLESKLGGAHGSQIMKYPIVNNKINTTIILVLQVFILFS